MIALLKIFDFVPSWIYAAIVAALLATNCASIMRMDAAKLETAKVRAEHAERVAKAETARASEEAKNRAKEKELQDAKDKISDLTQKQLDAAKDAADRAAVAGRRLRDAAATAALASRAACEASRTAPAGAPGTDPAGVLADVLGRIDARAGKLAEIADTSRVRGLACEASHDAARGAIK